MGRGHGKGEKTLNHRRRLGPRSMGLAKKLLVCKKCGARNPDHVLECRSCSATLRSPPANHSRSSRYRPASTQLPDPTEGQRVDGQKPIWRTEHRGRLALNLFLIALFAFILVMNLLNGASALNIAVVLVFLALSTTRFIYTWRKIRRGQLVY